MMTSLPHAPFKAFTLPTGHQAWIPSDLDLQIPQSSSVAPELIHYLAYIPWDARYTEMVDPAYRGLFDHVLPYLHVRTTDVHVATCLPLAKELIKASRGSVDEQVVHVAFILHDSGWSQMSEQEIADSLGVEGLALSGAAVGPKARHAELGRDLAQRILREYPLEPPLTGEQKDMVYRAIYFHDKPEQLTAMGDLPPSIQIVCDTDHLWSFTHENFWQDTVRKGVAPGIYLGNLAKDLHGYFVTGAGKDRARQMLEHRAVEVTSWQDWTKKN